MTTETRQPTLAELILTKKGDRTYEKLSRDCGGTPTGRRIQGIATLPIKSFPDPETMERLAIGLRVNVIDVLLASARSLGLRVSTDPNSLVIAGAGHLPVTAQEALSVMAGELLKLHQTAGPVNATQ